MNGYSNCQQNDIAWPSVAAQLQLINLRAGRQSRDFKAHPNVASQ